MVRRLESSDLLVTRIEGKNYAYIKPEIGDFAATRVVSTASVTGNVDGRTNPLNIKGGDVYLEHVSAANARLGLRFEGPTDIRVYDYKFVNTVSDQTFASAIKRDDHHTGAAEFLRVFADGKDYSANGRFDPAKNTDFFDNNNHSDAKGGAVFFRDVTLKNFYDAAFDAKSDVYVMNATIDGTTTGLRVWNGSNIYIVNSDIKGGARSFLAKFTESGGKIYYYNTTWNGKTAPDLSEITTWKVPTDSINYVKKNNIIELDSNPLPRVDPFFTVDKATYFAEVSINGGAWKRVEVPNGGRLSEHVGDTLIALPDFGPGDYRLRAWTVENGVRSAAVESPVFKLSADGVMAKSGAAPKFAVRAAEDGAPTPTGDPVPGAAAEIGIDPKSAVVTGAAANPRGGFDLVGGKADEVFVTSAGDDRITTGHGHDTIVFDTRGDIGDDVIVDFNRGRDALVFTEFVDLGSDTVQKLDSSGRFVLDDPALDANGGSIALGAHLAGRFIHYVGETEDGLFVYEIWNRPWSEIPGGWG